MWTGLKCESADFSLHARQHSAEAPCTLCRIHCCTHGSLHLGTLQRHTAPSAGSIAALAATAPWKWGRVHPLLHVQMALCTAALCSGTLHPLQNPPRHLLLCLPSNSVSFWARELGELQLQDGPQIPSAAATSFYFVLVASMSIKFFN